MKKTDVAAAAAWYAKKGFAVFPVHSVREGICTCGSKECEHPGKHPRTPRGFKDAITDVERIAMWWKRWPDANIGMATGAASGTLVLDVDPRNNGAESFRSLVAEYGPLPETAEQITGGDGRHIVLAHPGIAVPRVLAPGIDLKSDGGYIVVAPSLHVSGKCYRWNGSFGAKALLNLAAVPGWLLDLIGTLRNQTAGAKADCKQLVPGERNTKLTSLAGTMRRRAMSQESIAAALLEENRHRCNPPLPDAEVRSIADSVASYTVRNHSPEQNVERHVSTCFRLDDDAVFYVDPDPEKEPLRMCGRLEIAALTRDANGYGWGRLLKWLDAEGRPHEWAMPMSLLSGDGHEYRSRLLDGGLIISPGRKPRDLLTTYIQTTVVQARALSVPQAGWYRGTFVLPEATIGTAGAEQTILQTPHDLEHNLNVAGTLEEWKCNVGAMCSGNSRLIFSVSCAFAGPLLAVVGAESGGVHLVGSSSTGKSTALLVGGSVLGGGKRNGFVQSWRTTANGLEATADLHNDLTLFLDELSQIDPREAAEIAYLLANGAGKARMSRSITARKKLTWRLMFMSAGEITLSDHARAAGKRLRGGAEIRLLNVDADAKANMGLFEDIHGASSPDSFARHLQRSALQYYGSPLRAWLDLLTTKRSEVERAVRNFQTDFLKRNVPAGTCGEVSRGAQRFALIAAAGEIATEAGITGWQPEEAVNGVLRCYQSWLDLRGTSGATDTKAGISQVRQFLEAHGTSRFQAIGFGPNARGTNVPADAQPIRDRAGFRRRNPDNDETEYLIFQDTFNNEICSGQNYRHVRETLERHGYLVREQPHWTVKPRRLPEMPMGLRVYCICAAILEHAE